MQTNKTLVAPAQDFRVSYTKTAVNATPAIFAKSNLPQALSDEELDEVKGEFVQAVIVGAVRCAGYAPCREGVVTGARYVGTGLSIIGAVDTATEIVTGTGAIKTVRGWLGLP